MMLRRGGSGSTYGLSALAITMTMSLIDYKLNLNCKILLLKCFCFSFILNLKTTRCLSNRFGCDRSVCAKVAVVMVIIVLSISTYARERAVPMDNDRCVTIMKRLINSFWKIFKVPVTSTWSKFMETTCISLLRKICLQTTYNTSTVNKII